MSHFNNEAWPRNASLIESSNLTASIMMSHPNNEALSRNVSLIKSSNSTTNISSIFANQSADWLTLFPSYTLPVKANCSWVQNLRQVIKLTGPQITLTVCNENYLGVLANWLIYAVLQASVPLNNILIMSLDNDTHHAVTSKGFQSVYIPQNSIMQPGFKSIDYSDVWITRLTVIRLLNSWGYSVMTMDSDALIMKNIQPLLDHYDNSDIVASTGSYPGSLHKIWKTSLCMGVALFKATPSTGKPTYYIHHLYHTCTIWC